MCQAPTRQPCQHNPLPLSKPSHAAVKFQLTSGFSAPEGSLEEDDTSQHEGPLTVLIWEDRIETHFNLGFFELSGSATILKRAEKKSTNKNKAKDENRNER